MPVRTNITIVTNRLDLVWSRGPIAASRLIPLSLLRIATRGEEIVKDNTPEDEFHQANELSILKDSTSSAVTSSGPMGAAAFFQTKGIITKGESGNGANGYPLWKLLTKGRTTKYTVKPLRVPLLKWLDLDGWHYAGATSPGPITPRDYIPKSRTEISVFAAHEAHDVGAAILQDMIGA